MSGRDRDRLGRDYGKIIGDVNVKSKTVRSSPAKSQPVVSSGFHASSSVPQSLNTLGVSTGTGRTDTKTHRTQPAAISVKKSTVTDSLSKDVHLESQRTIVRSTTMDNMNNNETNSAYSHSHGLTRARTTTSHKHRQNQISSSNNNQCINLHEKDKHDLPNNNYPGKHVEDESNAFFEFGMKSPSRSSWGSNSSVNPFSRVHGGGGSKNSWLRGITTLHKNMFGTDISDEDAQTGIDILENQQSQIKHSFNESRVCDKLKIHLIKQGKDKEAKQFVQLHQDLKKSTLIVHREGILEFLYLLFDKEPTRATYAGKGAKLAATLAAAQQSEILKEIPVYEKEPSQPIKVEKNVINGSPTRAAVTGVKAAVATYGDKLMTLQNSPSNPRLSANFQSTVVSPRNSDGMERPNVTGRRSGQHPIKLGAFSPTVSAPQDFDTVDYDPCERDLPNRISSASRDFDINRDFEPIIIPKLDRPSDEETRDLIHRSSNRIPPLTTSDASSSTTTWTVFERPLCSTQDKFISLPTNHGRNLLSSTSTASSVDAFSGFHPNQSSAIGGTLNSELISHRKNQVTVSHSRPFSNQAALEKDLIKDLVYIFQGIDGNMLKMKPFDKYEINSGAHYLHPSLKMQALRLCELGYSYKKIRNWCDKPTTELISQGFKYALEKELQEFYRLLAVIQSMIQQTNVDTPMNEESTKPAEDLTILKLTVWVFDCRVRMEVVASMIETCENMKGGEICSTLFRYTQHGDPMISSMAISILSVVAKPMYVMLCQWILYGELEDPHNEFFIAIDKECKMEHLWHSMYRIRDKMLPSFITKASAERILATGKNINFLKHICQNNRGYECREEVRVMVETSPVECIFLEDDRILQNAIGKAYRTTSEMVLKVLIDEARLLDHLKAIKHYLLLGQGDFIQYLLELLQDELSKPASKIFSHNLSSILESAVRATNTQFEDEDILSRLDTRILIGNESDLGWDVFCLDYKAHGPIGTVLTEDVIDSYNKLFNTLWRTKRIEAMLSTLWKNQTTLFKYQKTIPELGTVLHRSQLLISEMIHFVHQTQYYIMFEATECAWDYLMEKVQKARDLDEVIKAHEDFIQTITKRSLLDFSKKELLSQLRGIFGYVHELKDFLMKFDEHVVVEMKRRKQKNAVLLESESTKQFFTQYVSHAKAKIEALYVRTQDMVRSFILLLNHLQDPDSLTLQCLSFRLDFNEYYALKDSRLSFPLTYQHRRLSSNAFSPSASQSVSGLGLNSQHGLGLNTSMSISEGMEDSVLL